MCRLPRRIPIPSAAWPAPPCWRARRANRAQAWSWPASARGAVLSLGMSPSWGFVIAACTALVLLLAFGGIGVSMQLERARGKHTDEAVEGVRAVLRILIVFAMITPFWSLFDQKASTWIVQANSMDSPLLSIFGWQFKLLPAQMQAVNPILVMLLIPFNNLALFPIMRFIGITPTPLRRMGMGIAFSALAWIVIGMIQLQMDGGDRVSILWQLLPYALLTLGEVLVSATGLEFAYSQAPAPMKGIILSFWYLAVTVGNLWVLIVNSGVKNDAVSAHMDRHQRTECDRVPDVLLRRLCPAHRRRLRAVRHALQDGG
jgi:POT family proton-dependent oligopeptide transporter